MNFNEFKGMWDVFRITMDSSALQRNSTKRRFRLKLQIIPDDDALNLLHPKRESFDSNGGETFKDNVFQNGLQATNPLG